MTVSTYILQNLFETNADADDKKTDIFILNFVLIYIFIYSKQLCALPVTPIRNQTLLGKNWNVIKYLFN